MGLMGQGGVVAGWGLRKERERIEISTQHARGSIPREPRSGSDDQQAQTTASSTRAPPALKPRFAVPRLQRLAVPPLRRGPILAPRRDVPDLFERLSPLPSGVGDCGFLHGLHGADEVPVRVSACTWGDRAVNISGGVCCNRGVSRSCYDNSSVGCGASSGD